LSVRSVVGGSWAVAITKFCSTNSDFSLPLVQALGFGSWPSGLSTIIDWAVHWNAGNTDESFTKAKANSVLLLVPEYFCDYRDFIFIPSHTYF
ncbi:hypothetical protein ACJONP_04690, partial [Mycoplasmopsis synoviae]